MRKILGIGFIVLGLACLLTALGFVVYNRQEDQNGGKTSDELLQNIQQQISEAPDAEPETTPDGVAAPRDMLTVPAGDYESIGVLSIPVLELELPVLKDWSYKKLKKAPCHYYGTCYEPNFVIAAHNYKSHFGRLSQLQAGDLVVFTDVTGEAYYYEVVLLETLPPVATEEMITSGFDLSLYTCTPGGGSRVTVRCRTLETAAAQALLHE